MCYYFIRIDSSTSNHSAIQKKSKAMKSVRATTKNEGHVAVSASRRRVSYQLLSADWTQRQWLTMWYSRCVWWLSRPLRYPIHNVVLCCCWARADGLVDADVWISTHDWSIQRGNEPADRLSVTILKFLLGFLKSFVAATIVPSRQRSMKEFFRVCKLKLKLRRYFHPLHFKSLRSPVLALQVYWFWK